MASLVVADTDLVIDFLRGRGPGAGLLRTLIADRQLRLTTVTAFEVRVGTDFLDRHDHIMRLFRSRTLQLDMASALRAGDTMAQLRSRGITIGSADCLQAGICLRQGLQLATRNRKRFEPVDGLELFDLSQP